MFYILLIIILISIIYKKYTDISNKYLKWMNDLEVHKYTEQKYTKHSLIDVRKFVLPTP